MPRLFCLFSYCGGDFVELKLPANGSASLPTLSRPKEESRCVGSREGEDIGDESMYKLGDDGGEENGGVYTGRWERCMEGERESSTANGCVFICVLVIHSCKRS